MSVDVQIDVDPGVLSGLPTRSRGTTRAPIRHLVPVKDDFDAAVAVPQKRRVGWERRYLGGLLALDLVIALLAGVAGYAARFDPSAAVVHRGYLAFAAGLPVLWLLLLAGNRCYERRNLYLGSEETRRVLRSGILLIAGVAFVSYMFRQDFSRGYMLCVFPALIVSTALGRYVLRKRLHRRRATGECVQRTVVVGHPVRAAEMIRRLRREQYHGLDVVAVCLPPGIAADHELDHVQLPLAQVRDIVDVVQRYGVQSVVVLASPEMDGSELRRLSWRLESTGAELLVAPALVDVTGPRTSVRLASGLPLLHVEPPEFSGLRRLSKSMLDRSAAALGLLLLSPLLVGIALMIWLEDHRSPVFRQRRVGRHGREFVLLKFRTMHIDAEERLADLVRRNEHDGVLFKMRSDPRVTRIGRQLRRFSLDELPQLINVLRGEMSLVGPRPPLPTEVSAYEPDLRRRLVVPPGLTGLWQVSGRSDLSWEESTYLDLHYVENWSPTLDLMILLKTFRAVTSASGAY